MAAKSDDGFRRDHSFYVAFFLCLLQGQSGLLT